MKTLKQQLNEALICERGIPYGDDDPSKVIADVIEKEKPERGDIFMRKFNTEHGIKFPTDLAKLLKTADIYEVPFKLDKEYVIFQYLRSKGEDGDLKWELDGTERSVDDKYDAETLLVAHPSPSGSEILMEFGELKALQWENGDALEFYIAVLADRLDLKY